MIYSRFGGGSQRMAWILPIASTVSFTSCLGHWAGLGQRQRAGVPQVPNLEAKT